MRSRIDKVISFTVIGLALSSGAETIVSPGYSWSAAPLRITAYNKVQPSRPASPDVINEVRRIFAMAGISVEWALAC
jgi:hypothetical protein